MDIDKHKKEQFILLALVLALLVMLPAAFFRKKPQKAASSYMAAHSAVAGPSLSTASVPLVAQGAEPLLPVVLDKEFQDIRLKDPFDLPAYLQKRLTIEEAVLDEAGEAAEEGDLPAIRIQGIVWGGKSPLAFIDDKVYKIGDKALDAEILDIDKKGIYFLYNGKKVLVRIKHKMQ